MHISSNIKIRNLDLKIFQVFQEMPDRKQLRNDLQFSPPLHIARLIALVDLQNGPSINGPGGNTIEYKSKVDITRHL